MSVTYKSVFEDELFTHLLKLSFVATTCSGYWTFSQFDICLKCIHILILR